MDNESKTTFKYFSTFSYSLYSVNFIRLEIKTIVE